MKNHKTTVRKSNRTIDLLDDLSTDQLAMVGAIALKYNDVESTIDVLIAHGLNLTRDVVLEVTSRINGIDGKIEIVKAALAEAGASADAQRVIANSLGNSGFMDLKRYRDSIIHARVRDAAAAIGHTAPKRGKFNEVLLSIEFLRGVYDRLVVMHLETSCACHIASDLAVLRKIHDISTTWETPSLQTIQEAMRDACNPIKEEVETRIRDATAELQKAQRIRLSLPPLPAIPDAP